MRTRAGSVAGSVAPKPISRLPSEPWMPLIARTRRNPARRGRAEIGEDREDLVGVVRIRCSQADDRTGVDRDRRRSFR